MPIATLWHVTIRAIQNWWKDNCLRLAASLAYYTALSLAPLVLLIVGVVGLVLDRQRTRTVDVARLAASVLRRRGRVSVEAMALAAGVSRQHLAREFRERLGISPKLYCRLARFHSGLVHAGRRASVDWAQAAPRVGDSRSFTR